MGMSVLNLKKNSLHEIRMLRMSVLNFFLFFSFTRYFNVLITLGMFGSQTKQNAFDTFFLTYTGLNF